MQKQFEYPATRSEPNVTPLQGTQIEWLLHARVSAITTGWWRATLQADSQARLRLEAPKHLGVADLWQKKI